LNSSLRYVNRLPKKLQAARLLWAIIYLLFFRFTPRWALHGWRRFLLRVFGARIGNGCRIDPTCKIWAPWNLVMGDYCALAADVDCYNVAPISLGSKVTISQRSFLCTASHDITSLLRPLFSLPIHIESHVWVAAEVMVHPGVKLGEGCVVGARAMVLKDVPTWSVVAGTPATVIANREVSDKHLLKTHQVKD
jgi:putative colanic acid biosynthesis acetyltransferase WcaF